MAETYDKLLLVGSLLPFTAVIAVVLFVLREVLDFRRRRSARNRKRLAIVTLMSHDIERNYWSLRLARECISDISDELEKRKDVSRINITRMAGGKDHFSREGIHGFSSRPIPTVYRDALSSNLLDLAEIDEKAFNSTLKAVDAISELDHVINSMIGHISDNHLELPIGSFAIKTGFVDYAENVLGDCEEYFKEFYAEITGRELSDFRVR